VARQFGHSSPTRAFPRKRGNGKQSECINSIRAKAVANRHEADVSTLFFVWFVARFDLARALLAQTPCAPRPNVTTRTSDGREHEVALSRIEECWAQAAAGADQSET